MSGTECLEYDAKTVTLYFPKGHVCCDLCPLLETYARKQCRRTGEYILDSRGRGMWCPFDNETEDSYGTEFQDFAANGD